MYHRQSVHPHAQHIERWLGIAAVEQMQRNMKDWYGPPIAVAGVPGDIFVHKGGDISGIIRAGAELSAFERAHDILNREQRRRWARAAKAKKMLGAFGSLSALIAAATGGKSVTIPFSKVGTAPTAILGAIDLWTCGTAPVAGAAGSAAPGGKAWALSDAGSMAFTAATVNANTSHFVNAAVTANAINSLLLYDRLFSVAKTMNATTTEAVTGVPTRYQNGTAGADDYIGGNFVFPSIPTTLLPATGHNWTVCQYTDQGSNTAQSMPSLAGISACALHQIDLLLGRWFMDLASGDSGVKALTQMQCSAAVATGTVDFVIAHAIAFMPVPLANIVCNIDGINTAFNLTKVYDTACLGLIELPKPATTATTYSGAVRTVSE